MTDVYTGTSRIRNQPEYIFAAVWVIITFFKKEKKKSLFRDYQSEEEI